MKYYFTYKTTNIINGKYYIGVHSTTDLTDGYLGSGKALIRAIEKYGKSNFSREILSFHNSKEEAYAMEAILVTIDVVHLSECYNMKVGGFGGWDHIQPRNHSEATKAKISKANKGKRRVGWNHTQETKDKIAASKANMSTESHQRLRDAKTGQNNPNFGKSTPLHVRKKISDAHKGTKATQQVKDKLSAMRKEQAKIKKECPHCQRMFDSLNYTRWHGDNCKSLA